VLRSAATGFGEAAAGAAALRGATLFGFTSDDSTLAGAALGCFATVFFGDFRVDFLADFFAAFSGAFFAAFFVFLTACFTAFLAAFLEVLATRFAFLPRFFAAALVARVFFAARFFAGLFFKFFLPGVATTISFIVQTDLPGMILQGFPAGRVLLHGFR
jgi:hypothetical protein